MIMKPIRAIGFDYFGVVGGIFGIDERMLALAQMLKEKGYKIGVLSNISGLGEELMRKKRLTIFDAVLTSGDIGCAKPDKRAFEIFTKQLGISLDELLFIDDAHSYMEPMESYGIRGILYTKYDTLVEALKKEGVF